jgi:hypothetical protein
MGKLNNHITTDVRGQLSLHAWGSRWCLAPIPLCPLAPFPRFFRHEQAYRLALASLRGYEWTANDPSLSEEIRTALSESITEKIGLGRDGS